MFIRVVSFILTLIISLQVSAMSVDELLHLHEIPSNNEFAFLEQILLSEISQEFISDPKNSGVLKTPKGQLLLKNQNRLLNILEVKRVFQKCQSEKNSRRQLYLRIISGAESVTPIEINCKKDLTLFSDVKAFSEEITRLSKNIELNELQKELHRNSFGNVVKSFTFMKRQFSNKITPEEVVTDICTNRYNVNLCSEEEKRIYLDIAKKQLKELEKLKPISDAQAAMEINKKVSKVNEKIKEIKPKTDPGWFNNFFFDTSDPLYDEASNKAYEQYEATYIEEATSGLGSLLLAPSIKEKVGHLKLKEEDEYENSDHVNNKTNYWFEKHNMITPQELRVGKEEALNEMKLQASKLNRQERVRELEGSTDGQEFNSVISQNKEDIIQLMNTNKKRERDIIRLLKTNPIAVGQLLAQSPEYAQTICNYIHKLEVKDEQDEFWDKTFFWGGIVVGGVLMATGLVALGGVLIARSVATTAFFNALGTGVTVAGAVTGSIESTYYGMELAKAKLNISLTEQSFISGQNDAIALLETKEALAEFNEAKFALALNLGFTAIDLAGLYGIMRGARYKNETLNTAQRQKIQTLSKMKNIIDQILGDKVLIKEFKKLMKSLGNTEVAKLISIIGHTGPDLAKKILSELKLKGATEFLAKAKQILRSAKECSK